MLSVMWVMFGQRSIIIKRSKVDAEHYCIFLKPQLNVFLQLQFYSLVYHEDRPSVGMFNQTVQGQNFYQKLIQSSTRCEFITVATPYWTFCQNPHAHVVWYAILWYFSLKQKAFTFNRVYKWSVLKLQKNMMFSVDL